jgi:hypothetical protein
MKFEWIVPVGLALFFLALCVPFATADATTENQSSASLIVTAVVDFSLNCSTLSLGTFAVGTVNLSAASQCNMSIYPDTNTITNISLNGTDFTNATFGTTLKMDNLSYSNLSSDTCGICNSSLRSSFYSGLMTQACNQTFNDWVMIPKPITSPTVRNVYFFVSIPSYQPKGKYSGYVYLKVTDIV